MYKSQHLRVPARRLHSRRSVVRTIGKTGLKFAEIGCIGTAFESACGCDMSGLRSRMGIETAKQMDIVGEG
jgi:hypothetical protein